MKLWRFKLKSDVDFDEWDGFVVRAETRRAAIALVAQRLGRHGTQVVAEFSCSELKVMGKADVILESFNAG